MEYTCLPRPLLSHLVDQAADAGSGLEECKTDWKHPSHGISIPPLPQVNSGRLGGNKAGQVCITHDVVSVLHLALRMGHKVVGEGGYQLVGTADLSRDEAERRDAY